MQTVIGQNILQAVEYQRQTEKIKTKTATIGGGRYGLSGHLSTNYGSGYVDYKIDNIRKNWNLFYKYSVKSDLIRCVQNTISLKVSTRKYKVVVRNKEIQKPSDLINARRLNVFFNSVLDITALMAQGCGDFCIYENGAMIIKRNQFGAILDVIHVPWLCMNPVISPDYQISYWEYTNPRGAKSVIPKDDVMHILPAVTDPRDPLFGIPRMCACIDSLRCQEELYDYLYYLLRNGNHEGLFINFNKTEMIDDGHLRSIIDDLRNTLEGKGNAGKPIITQDAQYQASSNNRQTPFAEQHLITAKQISRCFSMPEKYLNEAKQGQYGANLSVDDSLRLDEGIFSYEWPHLNAFNKTIIWGELGQKNLILIPDKQLSPINLDAARSISTAYKDNAITHDEYRSALGYNNDPDDDLKGMYAVDIMVDYGLVNKNSNTATSTVGGNISDGNEGNSDTESERQETES